MIFQGLQPLCRFLDKDSAPLQPRHASSFLTCFLGQTKKKQFLPHRKLLKHQVAVDVSPYQGADASLHWVAKVHRGLPSMSMNEGTTVVQLPGKEKQETKCARTTSKSKASEANSFPPHPLPLPLAALSPRQGLDSLAQLDFYSTITPRSKPFGQGQSREHVHCQCSYNTVFTCVCVSYRYDILRHVRP